MKFISICVLFCMVVSARSEQPGDIECTSTTRIVNCAKAEISDFNDWYCSRCCSRHPLDKLYKRGNWGLGEAKWGLQCCCNMPLVMGLDLSRRNYTERTPTFPDWAIQDYKEKNAGQA